jgi:osmoprotectant transport system substrate-binding protein
MQNLAHSASFHSDEKSAPSNPGIKHFDLTVLRDDRGFFPSYILAPVVRKATLERVPEIKTPLEKLSAQLDNETMAAAVDLQGRLVEDVASNFLRGRVLLSGP